MTTYVRSISQLAEDSPEARGHRLTHDEAVRTYGHALVDEVDREGAALLASSPNVAGEALRARRESLGLERRQVAAVARLAETIVGACEESRSTRVRDYEAIARVLGLDEALLPMRPAGTATQDLTGRLRTLSFDTARLSPTAVAGLAEAAWVAEQQLRLQAILFGNEPLHRFQPDERFGWSGTPAFRIGYDLAQSVRASLELGDRPIASLRVLVEQRLGVPVIQAELGPHLAGATVQVGSGRAIVVNLDGRNREVFVRRATFAHEVGHLLFDPEQRLLALRVDDFGELERDPQTVEDVVEQRANAFAAEFIIPQAALRAVYRSNDGGAVQAGMSRFGASFTMTRYQLWNALERSVPLGSLRAPPRPPEPEWEGAERFTVDYHPVRGLRPSRAGRFSALVVRAAQRQHLSWDTAASWLETTVDDLREAVPAIADLFPEVWRFEADAPGLPALGEARSKPR